MRAFYDLGFAPWKMAARACRLWLAAELDGLRLRAKQLFGARGAKRVPLDGAAAPALDSSRDALGSAAERP